MARVVARNLRHGWTAPIRLFEIARVFVPVDGQNLPDERSVLQMAWAGPARSTHPDDPSREVDLLDAAGELEALLLQFGHAVGRRPGEDRSWLRPGSAIDLFLGKTRVGELGEIAPTAARALDLPAPMLTATLEIEILAELDPGVVRCAPISAFPPARRDLSLVVPDAVSWGEVRDGLRRNLEEFLESCELFDVYEGDSLPEGTRALGVRLVLRSEKSTLKDQRVDRLLAKSLDDLKATHAIELR
jgi:phenylalanyl-tRNA synthetase beta chain